MGLLKIIIESFKELNYYSDLNQKEAHKWAS
jgi:hypothetical protein